MILKLGAAQRCGACRSTEIMLKNERLRGIDKAEDRPKRVCRMISLEGLASPDVRSFLSLLGGGLGRQNGERGWVG